MLSLFKRLWHQESGEDLTEYALLLLMVALGSVAGTQNFGKAIGHSFSAALDSLVAGSSGGQGGGGGQQGGGGNQQGGGGGDQGGGDGGGHDGGGGHGDQH